MALICIQLPDHNPIRACIEFPNGDEEILIPIHRCAYNRKHLFHPDKKSQRFCSDACRIAFNSRRRERKRGGV